MINHFGPGGTARQILAAAFLTSLAVAGIYFFKEVHGKVPATAAVVAAPPGVVSFAANAVQLSSIVTMAVGPIALPVSEPLFGRVAYDENRTARISSPIAGRVLSLHGEAGDQVRQSQVLAELDAPDFGTAQADWDKARVDQMRKQRTFDRAKVLFDGEVLARKDFESAEADIDQARAETRRATQRMHNLNAAGAGNGIFRLKSPLAGTITERQINPGQEVRPDLSAPLFVVSDLTHLWVIVDVPERLATGVHAGQPAVVESDAWPGERFTAVVDRVGIMLDPNTRRIQVRCTVQNPDLKLKPEMFTHLSLTEGSATQQVFDVPNTSLFVEGRYSYVYLQTKPGTFAKRRVEVKRSGAEHSYVSNGLVGGDQIVTEGGFLLNSEAGSDAR